VEAIDRQARERMEAALPLGGLPDLSAEGERDGFYQAQLIPAVFGPSTRLEVPAAEGPQPFFAAFSRTCRSVNS
jgi:hypothetical protein